MLLLAITFVVCLILGVPIAFSMGFSSLAYFLLYMPNAVTTIVQRNMGSVFSYTMLAVPFFILGGELMEKGGISERLVKFASAFVGHFRGGLGQVCVLTSMIFAGISGSGIADASAVGGLVIPAMKREGYDTRWAAALQANAATVGPIIPPSLNMIVYGSTVGVSIGAMFLGGLVPGVLMGVGLMLVIFIESFLPQYKFLAKGPKTSGKEKWIATKNALLALLTPIIIVGGICSGLFTATEAGAISVVYALVVGVFIYKKITWKVFFESIKNSIRTTGMVLLIVSFAGSFSYILSRVHFPSMVQAALTSVTSSNLGILLIMVVFLLVLTMFVEGLSALIMFAPVFYTLTNALGFDPVYFGVCVMLAILVGAATPPVGVLLYVSAGIANCRFTDLVKYCWPFLVVLLIVTFLCVFFPPLVTFVPNLFM